MTITEFLKRYAAQSADTKIITNAPVATDGNSLHKFLFTLYSILFTFYNILFTLYSILFTFYNILFTLYSILFTFYNILFTLYSILFALFDEFASCIHSIDSIRSVHCIIALSLCKRGIVS
jgi:hypothetical protein